MILLVEVDGVKTAVVGYGPGKGGEPMAIVIWKNPNGEMTLRPVKCSDVRPTNIPKKLERQLRHDLRHQRVET